MSVESTTKRAPKKFIEDSDEEMIQIEPSKKKVSFKEPELEVEPIQEPELEPEEDLPSEEQEAEEDKQEDDPISEEQEPEQESEEKEPEQEEEPMSKKAPKSNEGKGLGKGGASRYKKANSVEEDEVIEEEPVPKKVTKKVPKGKYDNLTLKQLQALLKERNIPGRSKFKSKESIIPVLEENDKTGEVFESKPPKKSKKTTASKTKEEEQVEPIEEDAEIETYTKQLLESLRKMKKHALTQDSEFKTGFAEYMKALCNQMQDYQSSM